MTREIKHQVIFKAAPAAVFAALMDERQHGLFTGEPAKISRKPGGAFHCYDQLHYRFQFGNHRTEAHRSGVALA